MDGCIYRTKDGECTIPNRSMEYGPLCRSDCTDKHPTNADRIRAMTDEELEVWLVNLCCASVGDAANARVQIIRGNLLNWLKQEVNE